MARRAFIGLAVAAVLAVLWATFALYTQPQFAVRVAEQIWGCFGGW